MSASIEKLRGALQQAAGDWDWKFSYAPKPGQQRIKITAQKIGRPELCRTIIFTEELCKTLTTSELVRHVTALLSSMPKEHKPHLSNAPDRVGRAVEPVKSLDQDYHTMRRSYAMKVADLRDKTVATPRPNLWLSLLGMSLRNLQITRK